MKPVASSLPGEVPVEPKGPVEPSPEEQFKAWVLDITKRVGDTEAALKQDRTILMKIDEGLEKLGAYRQQQPAQAGQPQQGFGLMDVLKMAKEFGITGGGTGMDELYLSAGRKLVDGVVDTTVKRVVKELGGEVASHVTLKE